MERFLFREARTFPTNFRAATAYQYEVTWTPAWKEIVAANFREE